MLKRIQIKAGLNREGTRYSTENGWYECDKVRFRQGTPEKIGGWERQSANTFLGVCRSLWNWVTLSGQNLMGVGTNLKFYIENGTAFYDVTPIRDTANLVNPFTTTNLSTTVLVTDAAHGCLTGDFVTYSGASAVGGLTLNGEFQVTVLTTGTYTITSASAATSSAVGGGAVTAAYQLNIGTAYAIPYTGWGAGPWGSGTWGYGVGSATAIRLWSQHNFGEDLVFAYRGGPICLWDATGGLTTRGVLVEDIVGASDVPIIVNNTLVSDINRFVFAFGCNELASSTLDPMLVRWSDQEDILNWTPAATNQAGSLRFSIGSEIVAVLQARQEVLAWTDSAMYSMQYVGAPDVWVAQLVGDNISIAGPNAVAYANGTTYWMGVDKFYKYDGTVQNIRCDLRRYVFSNFSHEQAFQVVAGTNEAFNEIWWWYCTANSTTVDRYVVYNYLEDIWYYGDMARTAWLDSNLRDFPTAATYSYNLVEHEKGVDDGTSSPAVPLAAHILSSEFDLDDGDHFMLVNRVLPDVTFDGSTADAPAISMTLMPLANSGSGYNSPLSVGGNSANTVTRTTTVPIEAFTGQVFVRIRGRQIAMKVESTALGVTWQLGAPRFDVRLDGRR